MKNNFKSFFKKITIAVILFISFLSYNKVYASVVVCTSSMSCTSAVTCAIDCGTNYVGTVTIVPGCTAGFTTSYSYPWSLTMNGSTISSTVDYQCTAPPTVNIFFSFLNKVKSVFLGFLSEKVFAMNYLAAS